MLLYLPCLKVIHNLSLLPFSNLSAGLKTFALLKMLMQQHMPGSDSILILDQPEAHMHPQWQIVLTEVVVLLQQQLDLKVLLITQSPYILDALETFAGKYGRAEHFKYYLTQTQSSEPESSVTIKDVSSNLEQIYQELARPYQDLENIRGLR